MDTRTGRVYASVEDAELAGVDREHIVELPLRTYVRPGDRVGVNDRCPCGSGRKFKRCCMRGSGR